MAGPHPGMTFGPVPSAHPAMPAHGFHTAPPQFHGKLPHAEAHPFVPHPGRVWGPGHDLGHFHGHDFAHFTHVDHEHWQHGSWHHTWHHGHYGWWWLVDSFWFFYPEPIYPYPLYVGADYYYDYYDQYGTPPYYWYYCEDPPGYYPYVQQCNGPWEPVPPSP